MNKKEFEIAIVDVEQDLNQLKARYDLWIQGMERVPPTRRRDTLERRMRSLRREQPNNTALKFKFQSVFARWTTLSTYWARITRQIEEGTFKRDIKRAKHRRANQERSKRAPITMRDEELDLSEAMAGNVGDIDAALNALEQQPSRPSRLPAESNTASARKTGVFGPPPGARPVRTVPPPPPAAARSAMARSTTAPTTTRTARPAPPPPPRRPAGLSSGELRSVYEKYVAARRKNNERVDNLSYDKLASRLRKMEPRLRKKHGAIDFQVVMKDGRVGLKPVKKKP